MSKIIKKMLPRDEKWIELAKSEGMKFDDLDGADKYLLHGMTKNGFLPVGLLHVIDLPEAYEPHVQWFPWASKRNKYQGFLDAMKFFGAVKNVLIMAERKYSDYYDAFAKRNVLRKVGNIDKMKCGEIHIYQAVTQ